MNNKNDDLVQAVDLFPIRVQPTLVKAKPVGQDDKVNRYDPAKAEATIPVGDNSYERTVRLHESLHAIYSPKGVDNTVVAQTCEDLRLHLNHAKLDGQPRRDEVASAVMDLRSITQLDKRYTWRMGNVDDDLLGVFLRGVAILQGHSGWTPSSKATRYSNLIKKAYANVKCKDKSKLGKSLKQAFDHLKKHDSIAIPIKILSKHFEDPQRQPQGGGDSYGDGSGGSGKPKPGTGINNPLIQTTQGEGDNWMMGWGGSDYEFNKIRLPNDMKYIADDKLKKLLKDLSEQGLIPDVTVHHLSLTHPKKSDKGPVTIMAFSGAKIRAKRLAAAMTSPVAVRLFKRRRVTTEGGWGGTILIDASGSMGIEDDALDELMTLAPYGNIAYYDGCDARPRDKGDIVVVAERGRQADLKTIPVGKKGRPERHGDNIVDLQGMQWMMTHPKPWYYLTDGQFTGPCSKAAKELLHRLLNTGAVKQVTSLKKMKEIILNETTTEDK